MDVVFEGSLSKAWGIKDVLQAIMDVPNVPFGLLRVSSASLQGKIIISDSTHIVGASSSYKTDRDSYDALRSLLELKDGTFAYLDLMSDLSDSVDLERTLFISLARVLETCPALPDDSSQLFDEAGMLDRIFGAEQDFQPLAAPTKFELPCEIPKNPMKKTASVPVSASPPITLWTVMELPEIEPVGETTAPRIVSTTMLEPQLSSAPVQSTEGYETRSMIPAYVHTPDEQRASFQRLRSFPAPKPAASWQEEPIKWLLSALGIN